MKNQTVKSSAELHQPASDADSQGQTKEAILKLHHEICEKMISDFSQLSQNVLSKDEIQELLLQYCEAPQSSTALSIRALFGNYDFYHDYLAGMALALNPLPENEENFETSDLEALRSDWSAVRGDIGGVWNATSRIYQLLEWASNVRHGEQHTSPVADNEPAPADERDQRNHSASAR
jgi:hypothetical protein